MAEAQIERQVEGQAMQGVDGQLKRLRAQLEDARRARMEAQSAGEDLENLVGQMQAGRSLQDIELEELAVREELLRGRRAACA